MEIAVRHTCQMHSCRQLSDLCKDLIQRFFPVFFHKNIAHRFHGRNESDHKIFIF